MLICRLIGPGRFKEKWQKLAFEDYQKRLSRSCKLELVELPDAPDQLPEKEALAREAEAILKQIKPTDYVLLLDLEGTEVDSPALAKLLDKAFADGASRLTVVHGGSRGLAAELRTRAKGRICLSRLTFTHLMSRVIFAEQLYRAMKILAGEPYHK